MPEHPPAIPTMPETLLLRPNDGEATQLFILLHGVGGQARDMLPLGQQLRERFPRSAVVLPNGFDAFDAGPTGRQWFSIQGVTEDNRPTRVAEVLPRLVTFIEQVQHQLGIAREATALVGFSQGAILSLEAVQRVDGLAGRVLAFSGRYAQLPDHAPRQTTVHLLHGGDDPVIPADRAREAIAHLGTLQADATIDIAKGVGHELHPALVDCAFHVLTNYLPQRTWREAMRLARETAQDNDAEPVDGQP